MESVPAASDGPSDFQQLLRLARAGDHGARERLYLDYGPHFRRVILRRLKAKRIEWATTPHDIFDSVVCRVWEEDALNSLGSEEEFLKYVSRAVERKVRDLRRHLTARRRDYRRMEALGEDESNLISADADPARRASFNEDLESIRARLPEQDRQILEMWLAGKSWVSIGARFSSGIEAIRKRFHRSLALIRRMFTEQ